MSSSSNAKNASTEPVAFTSSLSSGDYSSPDERFGEEHHIDLRLPRVSVLTAYDDKSYTRVKLAAVFPGKVSFVPWKKFDDLVMTTTKKVNSIPEYLLVQVNSWLDNCRKVIDPKTYGPPDHHLSEKVKEWFENPDFIPSGFEAKDRIEPEEYLTKQELGSFSDLPRGRAVQGSSTARPSTGFNLSNSRGQRTYKQGMSVEEAKQTGVPVYLNTTSCSPLNAAVMIIIEQLLRIIRGKNDYFLAPELPLSSELARAYDLDRGPSEFLNLIPHYALIREFNRPAEELPTFSVELKGPMREFWRSRRFEEDSDQNANDGNKDSDPCRVEVARGSGRALKSSDVAIPATRKAPVTAKGANTSSHPGVHNNRNTDENNQLHAHRDSNEGKRPSKKSRKGKLTHTLGVEVARISRTEDSYNYSAEGLAKFYNDLFKDRNILDSADDRYEYYFKFLPVAQALSQALLSKSGYCALYNHQEGVAFKIEKANESDGVPLLVHVSRAYPCDREPGNLAMLLTLANESSALIALEPTKKNEMRRLFLDMADKFVEEKLSKDIPKPQNSGSGGQRGSNSGGGGNTSTNGSSEGGNAGTSGSSNRQRTDGVTQAALEVENVSDVSSERSDITMSMGEKCEKDVDTLSQAFVDIFRNNHGVIDSGASGMILRGTFHGHLVAIKSWNGVTREGLENLLNEIRIYKALESRQAKVLGTGIPLIRLSRTMPAEDAVLVIDYVGKCLRRLADGSLALYEHRRYKILSDDIAKKIGNAALRSLRLLHECGVLHGDINLSNLRVERESPGEIGSWRAWWIDLGLSRDGWTGHLEMEVERQRVASMFPEAKFDVLIGVD